MEDELDAIEEGKEHWVDAIRRFYGSFKKDLDRAETEMPSVKGEGQKTDLVCDKCGSPMVIKWGRQGEFLACSAYPECRNTKNFTIDDDGKIKIEEIVGAPGAMPEVRQGDARCGTAASASFSAAPGIPNAATYNPSRRRRVRSASRAPNASRETFRSAARAAARRSTAAIATRNASSRPGIRRSSRPARTAAPSTSSRR